MAFMGITLLGPQNYFHTVMKADYKEPGNAEDVKKLMTFIEKTPGCPEKLQRPYVKGVQKADVYIGRLDGFAYGSKERFITMKRKGVLKPVGPTDMYKKAATEQCNYGWFVCDPAVTNASWVQTHPRSPKPISPNTKVLDAERKINKYARLF